MSDLLEAVYRGDESRIKELLAEEPELDIFEAAAVGRSERVEQLLDVDPGLVSAWTDDGFTPLHLAAFFRRPETARILVERGALDRCRCEERPTPGDAVAERRGRS